MRSPGGLRTRSLALPTTQWSHGTRRDALRPTPCRSASVVHRYGEGSRLTSDVPDFLVDFDCDVAAQRGNVHVELAKL